MAAIRGINTKPELMIRRALHAAGLRYRLYAKELPGKPDLVLPRWHAVIFVNGCFWHQHDCHLFRWPATRHDFWRAKIGRNHENDIRSTKALCEAGWRVATVWECALKGRTRLEFSALVDALAEWVRGDSGSIDLRGQACPN